MLVGKSRVSFNVLLLFEKAGVLLHAHQCTATEGFLYDSHRALKRYYSVLVLLVELTFLTIAKTVIT